MVSHDVVALYPSIPQDEAIQVIHEKPIIDEDLIEKTKMTPNEIITLLKICVSGTYFVFNKKLYIQVKGLAIGASTYQTNTNTNTLPLTTTSVKT